MPSEPARELMRKTRTCRASAARGGRQTLCTSTWHALELAARRRTWQPGELNASIIACRAWALVLPSSRKYGTTLRRGSKGARVCALNAAGGATSDSSSRLERHAAPLPTSRLTCHAGRAPPPPRHRWAATGGKQQACEWAQRGSTSRGRGRSAAPLPAPVAAPAGIAGRSLGLCRGGSARQHPAAVLKVVKKVLHDVQHLRVWVCVWGGGRPHMLTLGAAAQPRHAVALPTPSPQLPSRTSMLCEKSRTRCPPASRRGSSCCSTRSLPLAATMRRQASSSRPSSRISCVGTQGGVHVRIRTLAAPPSTGQSDAHEAPAHALGAPARAAGRGGCTPGAAG